jgi:predicted CXXCH cytochrome family protein
MVSVTIHLCVKNAFSFNSAEEYLNHAKRSDSCVTEQCHSQLTEKAFQHKPVRNGKCTVCHRADAYPDRYGLEAVQSIVCYGCHRDVENKIQSDHVINGPIKNGDCSSCHDPHGSERSNLLRKSNDKLCSICHRQEVLYSGEFIHKPVKDGNCGLCHDPHASDFKFRLTEIGANLFDMSRRYDARHDRGKRAQTSD